MSQLSEHLAGMRPSPILKMVQGIVWRRIKTCSTRQASFIPVLNNPIVVYHVISCLSFVLLPPPSFATYWPSVNWLSATSATVFRWGLRWTTPPLPDMLDRSMPLRWKSCLQISSEECVWVKSIPKSRWFKLVQHVLILLYTTAMSQCGNFVATFVTHRPIPTWQPGCGRMWSGSNDVFSKMVDAALCENAWSSSLLLKTYKIAHFLNQAAPRNSLPCCPW